MDIPCGIEASYSVQKADTAFLNQVFKIQNPTILVCKLLHQPQIPGYQHAFCAAVAHGSRLAEYLIRHLPGKVFHVPIILSVQKRQLAYTYHTLSGDNCQVIYRKN